MMKEVETDLSGQIIHFPRLRLSLLDQGVKHGYTLPYTFKIVSLRSLPCALQAK